MEPVPNRASSESRRPAAAAQPLKSNQDIPINHKVENKPFHGTEQQGPFTVVHHYEGGANHSVHNDMGSALNSVAGHSAGTSEAIGQPKTPAMHANRHQGVFTIQAGNGLRSTGTTTHHFENGQHHVSTTFHTDASSPGTKPFNERVSRAANSVRMARSMGNARR